MCSGQAGTQGWPQAPQASGESRPASQGGDGPSGGAGGGADGFAKSPVSSARRDRSRGSPIQFTEELSTSGATFTCPTWHWVHTHRDPLTFAVAPSSPSCR